MNAKKRPSSRGAFLFGEITIDCVSSNLEHFSEGPCIRRQGKRSDSMPFRHRLYFRLHSEGTEEDR